jgi:hypothetical protein
MKSTEKLKYRIIKLVSGKEIQNKVDKGLERRQELYESMKNGENIEENYRYRFLMDGAHEVIEKLGELATKFNDANPDERFSSFDMVDVLNTALAILVKASED